MLHDSNNKKRMDKNLKLMALSAIVLVVLFFYTIYKSSSYIQSSSYSVGIVFLLILFIFALVARMYKKQIQTYLNKTRQNNESVFQSVLEQEQRKDEPEIDSNIEMIQSDVSFKDVAGIDAVKEELEEIVTFLNEPKKFLKYDVKLPKGVLLVGPPGVGKTLIARAVAGEANVPFFYQSGASFVQIYVGMGAKKVRELFAKAKANAPAIVFIDEIDAIGKQRTGSSNDEREATLNELLTQMDGFEGDSGVIVVAATNKVEVLDDALLRAGRFDRRVFVELPNIENRKKILELYLKRVNYNFDVDKLAHALAGFSSAAIATLINEAKLNMIKRSDKIINADDIEVAKNKLEFGKKEIKILSETDKEILSIYQASKAYITQQKTTLFQEGFDKKDSPYPSYEDLLWELKAYLAGSVGVELLKDQKYAVNSKDLKQARNLCLVMVEEYEMAASVDQLLEQTKEQLKALLSENKEELIKLSSLMNEQEVVRF